jgi:hypothetical protein
VLGELEEKRKGGIEGKFFLEIKPMKTGLL